ncbi:glycoside hydrolase family 2 protein [Fimbriimonas ginsengisoli]|nr:glycoside hydrolase family 2 [Fimbriimonas ginsengisoli]
MSVKIQPRPEYPRPQFVRQQWTNLNGEWEFAFDDQETGIAESWFDGRSLDRRITVPFPYQSEASGINEKEVHEVVWYARDFDFHPEWRGQDLLLHFGAVDYASTVWVNGNLVGGNRGGHVPFTFDIAPYLTEGSNRIVVRVEDRQDPCQPRGKQSVSGKPVGIDYYCTTGIWQTVWLEPVPQVRIERIRVTPDVEESAFKLSVYLHAPAANWTIEADVLEGENVVATLRKNTTNASARLFVRVPDAKLWSPDTPNLYDLRVRILQNGERLDEVESYAGMRSIELRNGEFLLNGEAVYLKMVLDQGYWPESYLAAPSDDALRADVEITKELGFNGSRKHQKVEDPRWLYWCDKLGLLVWGEMANARDWSPEAEEMLLSEWQRVVQRDYNSPAIVSWVPLNESWGVPEIDKGHAAQYAFVERAVNATRFLDPHRPVIDNDGWEHTDVSDVVTIHDYTSSGEEMFAKYAQTAAGGALPDRTWWDGKLTFAQRGHYRGQPVMLTEVGGFLIRPHWLPADQWDVLYDTYGSVNDTAELLAKYEDLMGAIASLRFVSGFCYTQLTDVEQEINGLLTFDRRPKVPVAEIARINHSLRLRPSEAPAEIAAC